MHPGFTTLALAVLLATACPLVEIEDRLARADEHLFWAEFWTELDDGEAGRELGYAIADLERAQVLNDSESCREHGLSPSTARIVQRRLAACLRAQQASR